MVKGKGQKTLAKGSQFFGGMAHRKTLSFGQTCSFPSPHLLPLTTPFPTTP